MMSTLIDEQNERKLLRFLESILPGLTGKCENKFKTDRIVASLKDITGCMIQTLESELDVPKKTRTRLHDRDRKS